MNYISEKPVKCECGYSDFFDRENSWKCKRCGKNFGKSIAKVTVEREINGKMKIIGISNLRPDRKTIKRIDLIEQGNNKFKKKSSTVIREDGKETVIQKNK